MSVRADLLAGSHGDRLCSWRAFPVSYPTTEDVLRHLQGYPRSLRWADFRRVNQSPDPPFNAQTATGFASRWGPANLQAGVYRLSRVAVTISLVRQPTWVVTSFLQNASQADQANLLLHEQGHHDIIGLIRGTCAASSCRFRSVPTSWTSSGMRVTPHGHDSPTFAATSRSRPTPRARPPRR